MNNIKPCRPKWKGTMTDRERFVSQMSGKPFDRCFNMEYGYWEDNYRQWPLFTENGITSEGEANAFFPSAGLIPTCDHSAGNLAEILPPSIVLGFRSAHRALSCPVLASSPTSRSLSACGRKCPLGTRSLTVPLSVAAGYASLRLLAGR